MRTYPPGTRLTLSAYVDHSDADNMSLVFGPDPGCVNEMGRFVISLNQLSGAKFGDAIMAAKVRPRQRVAELLRSALRELEREA